MKQNLQDFEKALSFVAVWAGYAQAQSNDPGTLREVFIAITGWDVDRAVDAFDQCIAKGLIETSEANK